VVEYAIIGHALKDVADAWLAAPANEAEVHLRTADVMLAVTGGLFHSFVAWMLGLPYVLFGTAVVLGTGYPRWLGWVAVVAALGRCWQVRPASWGSDWCRIHCCMGDS
jgi:hypothetical protein